MTADLLGESLRTVGPKGGQSLCKAGIITIDELERPDPVVAFLSVKQHQPKVSLDVFWAMVAVLKRKNLRELDKAINERP